MDKNENDWINDIDSGLRRFTRNLLIILALFIFIAGVIFIMIWMISNINL